MDHSISYLQMKNETASNIFFRVLNIVHKNKTRIFLF